jgi:hypothetical protein
MKAQQKRIIDVPRGEWLGQNRLPQAVSGLKPDKIFGDL